MSRLDDRLTDELERAARPADTAGVFERIDGRRVRRHRARRVRAGALAVVVIAGSIGGFAYLTRAFGPTRIPGGGGEASVRDGLIVVSVFDQFGLGHLWLDDPTTGERRPLMVESPTQTATSDGSPAVSPDGLTVAFARSDGRHGSAIYTVGIDGEGLTKIADPGVDPAWSPDGSRIAFTRDLLGSGGLWTMNADGSDPTLVLGTKTLSIGDPAWSPDGTTLAFEAFHSGDEQHVCDLFTIPLDATGPDELRQLTNTPDRNELSPSWSPDGTRIVYSQMSSHPPNADERGGIVVMTIAGGDVVFLTEGGGPYDQNPTWSPSGASVAFDRSINGQATVYTIGTDGSDLTEVGEGVDPAWQAVRSGPSISPSVVPSPSPADGQAADIGLGFPVCNVQLLGGDAEGGGNPDFDGDGRVDTAYLATKKSDVGGCPQADTASNILGIDLTGDGMIDVEFGPISCGVGCMPFMAIDLDDDGDDELFVQQLGGAILGLVPYGIVSVDGSPALGALTVIPPGAPDHGFAPDEPPTFYLGGDEGFSASLECRGSGEGRVLVETTGQLDSIEQPTRWTIHRTTFRLGSQGFDVVDIETFDELVKDEITPGSQQETSLCGIPFPPNPVFEIP